MLHYKTINPPTLGLLKQLLEIPEFQNLRLVGGTSLALQIGHRKSIDLELFGQLRTDEFEISKILSLIGKAILLHKTPNIFIYTINEIKVDIVNYPYPWIEDILKKDDLTLAGKKDISAMKLAAITGRGSKKDFIDLYFLLQEFSLERILLFYQEKYYDGSQFLVLKSLTYFDDADSDVDPVMLKKVNWEHIKLFIKNKVEDYIINANNHNH